MCRHALGVDVQGGLKGGVQRGGSEGRPCVSVVVPVRESIVPAHVLHRPGASWSPPGWLRVATMFSPATVHCEECEQRRNSSSAVANNRQSNRAQPLFA